MSIIDRNFAREAVQDTYHRKEKLLAATSLDANPNSLKGSGWVELQGPPVMAFDSLERFKNAASLTAAEREASYQQRLQFLDTNTVTATQSPKEQLMFRFIYKIEYMFKTDRGERIQVLDYIEYFIETGETRWSKLPAEKDHLSGDNHPTIHWEHRPLRDPDLTNWLAALRGVLGDAKSLLPEIKVEGVPSHLATDYIATSHNTFIAIQSYDMIHDGDMTRKKSYHLTLIPCTDGTFWAINTFADGFVFSSHRDYKHPKGRKIVQSRSLRAAVRHLRKTPVSKDIIRLINHRLGTNI